MCFCVPLCSNVNAWTAKRRGSTYQHNALGTFFYVIHVCNIIHGQMDPVFLYSSRANNTIKKAARTFLRRNLNRQKSSVTELKVTVTIKRQPFNCIHSSHSLPHILPSLCLRNVFWVKTTRSLAINCKQATPNSDWLRAGRSGDRIPVGGVIFTHGQTGPGAHPVSCTMDTGSFPGLKRSGRGVDHPPPPSAEVESE
jgi:hypothetical protein